MTIRVSYLARLLGAAAACAIVSLPGLSAATAKSRLSQSALFARFDAQISAPLQQAWDKHMASNPNQVGSPHDKANALWELGEFKKFGWKAHIEVFDVLYPTPRREKLEILGPHPFAATLTEPALPGDGSASETEPALPAYLAYQGDGDVTAPIVYVNYGMKADYAELARMGIGVKGKIVIARYGHGWRGLKVLLAQQHGALGCIIYSDPADDGYATGGVYPNGPQRPPFGIQRGSVEDTSVMNGDPLTPGYGAVPGAKRIPIKASPAILKIPALPISYADAEHFLALLTGNVVPAGWRGALPLTYRVGPSKVAVHLLVRSDWSLKPIYDVIAKIKGSQYPDQWVIRGNHHDGWVEGAADPLSGQVALLNEAKAIGQLVKSGWRPKRTIIYTSWDGEEPGLLGSVEWVETHAAALRKHALVYINSDTNARGILYISGSQDWTAFADHLDAKVADPETKVPVETRRRATLRVRALAPLADAQARFAARLAANPSDNAPLGALGSGSDYGGFYDHLGIAALNIGYGGEGHTDGVYHSRYDTFAHQMRFGDPGFVYGTVLAKTIGHLVLAAADSTLPPQHPADLAKAVDFFIKDIRKEEKTRRKAAARQRAMLRDNVFNLAADPTRTHGNPPALKSVPHVNLTPLEEAASHLDRAAKAYEVAFAAKSGTLSAAARSKLFAIMFGIDEKLSDPRGLIGRPWYKNLISAPGRYTGYGAKTLPGVREAIEEGRWSDAQASAVQAAMAITAYCKQLKKATALLMRS